MIYFVGGAFTLRLSGPDPVVAWNMTSQVIASTPLPDDDEAMHEPVDVVRTYCDAWLAGDTMTVVGPYHPELTLIWPGRHRLAGTHIGLDASVTALLDLQAITNRRPIEVEQILVGPDSVMATVIERWTTDGVDRPEDGEPRSLDLRRVLEWTVCDGQLRACRVFESAQGEIDAWIAAETSEDEA